MIKKQFLLLQYSVKRDYCFEQKPQKYLICYFLNDGNNIFFLYRLLIFRFVENVD